MSTAVGGGGGGALRQQTLFVEPGNQSEGTRVKESEEDSNAMISCSATADGQ